MSATTGFIIDIIIIIVRAFVFMLLWNVLIANDIGLDTISFSGAMGVSLVFSLFGTFSYSDVKAIATDG